MTLIEKKKELLKNLNYHHKKILDIELELTKIESDLTSFSEKEILEKLVLNDQQRKIVESDDKNMLVIACPGSGKTHTLISRYINLVVNKNVDPDDIILITFTKKAGQEMLDRIKEIIPNKIPFYVGSLHGLGYRLLQKYHNINYTVLDDKESKQLLKSVSVDEFLDLEENDIQLIKSTINDIYNISSCSYPFNISTAIEKFRMTKLKKYINLVLKEYKKIKKEENLVDFNDLMILFGNLVTTKKFEPFLEKIKYVFFDEYQDINPIQNYILEKFQGNSNIMAVGDDAQSIYSFRGSNVNYIWNFKDNFKNTNIYYLETNYRSTSTIVNLFQNIIKNNKNQFEKKVISNQEKKGIKPHIIQFNDVRDQHKWVVQNILEKHKQGIKYSDMVILARTNNCLSSIEYEMLKYKIPISKNIGLSLLDKAHVKDFLAFIVILINPKSSIHWKRVLSIHKEIGLTKANIIIENSSNIYESFKNYVNNNELQDNNLYMFLKKIFTIKNEKEIILLIQNYLENLWIKNHTQKIDDKVIEIKNLLLYLGNDKLESFISNLYLNLDINCDIEDTLFLSTVHGSKGLEWDYVYIIDVHSNIFPNIRQSHFKNQLHDMEEERRLLYVATSRAKKFLTISYYQDLNNEKMICISPFLQEINEEYYRSSNLSKVKLKYQGIISQDVNSYIRYIGFNDITKLINNLEYTRCNISTHFELPDNISKLKYKYILGNFFDYLIAKICQNNFPNKCKKFDLNLNHMYNNFPKSIYHKYKDKLSDWRDILDELMFISGYKCSNENIVEEYKTILTSDLFLDFYKKLEKNFVKFIKNINPKQIKNHFNITHSKLKGECDLLIDDHLIEIKTTNNEACTMSNLLQTLMYGYLLKKKDINITKISIYNVLNGTLDTFDVKNFNFIKLKKNIYC